MHVPPSSLTTRDGYTSNPLYAPNNGAQTDNAVKGYPVLSGLGNSPVSPTFQGVVPPAPTLGSVREGYQPSTNNISEQHITDGDQGSSSQGLIEIERYLSKHISGVTGNPVPFAANIARTAVTVLADNRYTLDNLEAILTTRGGEYLAMLVRRLFASSNNVAQMKEAIMFDTTVTSLIVKYLMISS